MNTVPELSQTEQGGVRLNTVIDSAESDWTLSWTALFRIEHCAESSCHGKRWVRLNTVMDRANTDWTLSLTALSQTEHCHGQRSRCHGKRWVRLHNVIESADLDWALPWTALSQADMKSAAQQPYNLTLRKMSCIDYLKTKKQHYVFLNCKFGTFCVIDLYCENL